ncbi:MAG: Group 1 glycosyl transferase [Microgenomates group bacterium Gr01-1014_7]|nr:MAG: Group 1 glycosyl transferase [Microgenomates group bacterium Gr01-1014_7]
MKVALAHDFLREYGGAERVLEVLHEIFPDAPVYTTYANLDAMGENGKRFKSWDLRPSWFQKFPFANQLLSPFRIFAPLMFESFDLSEYNLVISSSSATHLAKSVITRPETLHISYIHTPPRFLYGYTTSFNYKKRWWTRIGGEIINHFMRIYDFEVSQRPDILIANSKNVQSRIKKFYRRDSVVIYPPVDLESIKYRVLGIKGKKKDYFLVLSRLTRGKGVDVIIEACARLGLPLKIAGTGPELKSLMFKVKSENLNNIEFLEWVSDEERIKLLQNAKALIVASEDEDFGITSIEAQATGTPVIAPASGGFLETVIDQKTGLLYDGSGQVTVESLVEALQSFDSQEFKIDDLLKNAEKFSKERFKKEILDLVDKNLKNYG